MVQGHCLCAHLSKKASSSCQNLFLERSGSRLTWSLAPSSPWEQTNLEYCTFVSSALISFRCSKFFTWSKTRLSLPCSKQNTCCNKNILRPWGWGITSMVSMLHANTSSPYVYWRKRTNQWAHLEPYHRNPDTLERMPNRIVLSNSTARKCAPKQYKTMRIWESFNHQGTKMSLLSDELWLITSPKDLHGNKAQNKK